MSNLQMDSFVASMNRLMHHDIGYRYYEHENLELIKIIIEEIFMDMEGFYNKVIHQAKYFNYDLRTFVEDINDMVIDQSSRSPTISAEHILDTICSVINSCGIKNIKYMGCNDYRNEDVIYALLDLIRKNIINSKNSKCVDFYTFIFNTISNWLLYTNEKDLNYIIYNHLTKIFVDTYKHIDLDIRDYPYLYNSIHLMRIAIITSYINMHGEINVMGPVIENGYETIDVSDDLKVIENILYKNIFEPLSLSLSDRGKNFMNKLINKGK